MLSRMSNGAAQSERRGCMSLAVAPLAVGCGLRGRAGGRAPGLLPAPSARAPQGSIHPAPTTNTPAGARAHRYASYALRATRYELATNSRASENCHCLPLFFCHKTRSTLEEKGKSKLCQTVQICIHFCRADNRCFFCSKLRTLTIRRKFGWSWITNLTCKIEIILNGSLSTN